MSEQVEAVARGRPKAELKSNLALRHLTQKVAFVFLWLAGLTAVFFLLAVVGYVMWQGVRLITPDFLLKPPRGGLSGEGGISTTIVTTAIHRFIVLPLPKEAHSEDSILSGSPRLIAGLPIGFTARETEVRQCRLYACLNEVSGASEWKQLLRRL